MEEATWQKRIADLRRWIEASSATSPARAARRRTRRARLTSGPAKRRVKRDARAGWRAIAGSRNSSSRHRGGDRGEPRNRRRQSELGADRRAATTAVARLTTDAPGVSRGDLPVQYLTGYNRSGSRAATGTGRSSNGRTSDSGLRLSGFESLPPSQSHSLGWSVRLQAGARLTARLGSNPCLRRVSLRSPLTHRAISLTFASLAGWSARLQSHRDSSRLVANTIADHEPHVSNASSCVQKPISRVAGDAREAIERCPPDEWLSPTTRMRSGRCHITPCSSPTCIFSATKRRLGVGTSSRRGRRHRG